MPRETSLNLINRSTEVEADIAAIRKIFDQYKFAWESEDLDLFISLWTDDAMEMVPGRPALVGKEQMVEMWRPFFDKFIMKLPMPPKEIVVAGDWAFCRGTYVFSVTPKAGGDTVERAGKYLSILERQADGSWKIARECFNYDAPPPKREKE